MFNGNLLDFFWTMMIIFFWVIAIMIWVQTFTDLIRRDDLGGGMKVLWTIFLFIVPWITVLVYIFTRPKVTAQDVQNLVRAEAATKAAGQVSTADELAKLKSLKDASVITEQQYEDLKAKLLA
jgi:Short C-terminal domain